MPKGTDRRDSSDMHRVSAHAWHAILHGSLLGHSFAPGCDVTQGVCEKKTLEDPLGMLFRRLVPRIHILVTQRSLNRIYRPVLPWFRVRTQGSTYPGTHALHLCYFFFVLYSRNAHRGDPTPDQLRGFVGYVLRILESVFALDVGGVLSGQHFCESVATQHHHQKSSPRLLRITLPLINKPSCLHLI